MNRKEFMNNLSSSLSSLSQDDRRSILSDFEEHFDVGLAAGRTEEDIAQALGDPAEIAKEFSYKKEDAFTKDKASKENCSEKQTEDNSRKIEATSNKNLNIDITTIETRVIYTDGDYIEAKILRDFQKMNFNFSLYEDELSYNLIVKPFNAFDFGFSKIFHGINNHPVLELYLPIKLKFPKITIKLNASKLVCPNLDGDVYLVANACKVKINTLSNISTVKANASSVEINNIFGDFNGEFNAGDADIYFRDFKNVYLNLNAGNLDLFVPEDLSYSLKSDTSVGAINIFDPKFKRTREIDNFVTRKIDGYSIADGERAITIRSTASNMKLATKSF